jgi:hypothetical protein
LKKIALWSGYFFLFVLFFLFFLPKKELYYQAERLLEKEKIVISKEKLADRGLWFTAQKGEVYIKGIPIGSFKKVTIYPAVLVNLLHISEFHTNPSISFFPKTVVNRLDLFYSPFYPFKIVINGETSIGSLKGEIDIKSKKGFIDIFAEPKELRKYFRLTKVKEGHYRYAFSY